MKTKIVNLFDPLTGIFAGTIEVHESPEEKGVFIEPIHSTADPLPAGITGGQVAVRLMLDGVTVPKDGVSGAWVLKPEHRGETWYDKTTGAPVVINTLDILANLAATKPAALLLDEAKTARIAFIENEYELREHANITYMAATFQADDEAQKLIARVLAAQGGTAPAGFGWYDISNSKVLMTNAQLQGLANAIFLRNQPLFENKQARKAAIRAATVLADVVAVVW